MNFFRLLLVEIKLIKKNQKRKTVNEAPKKK